MARAQPDQPATLAELQTLLDPSSTTTTTTDRTAHSPHRPPPPPPTTSPTQSHPHRQPQPDTHYRVRHDRVDNAGNVTLRVAGRLHHIGLGRTHDRTHVIVLIDDLDIRVIDAATGELLRHLTLDPTALPRHRHARPGPTPRKRNKPNPPGSAVRDVLRHHMVGLTGFEPATPCPSTRAVTDRSSFVERCADLRKHRSRRLAPCSVLTSKAAF